MVDYDESIEKLESYIHVYSGMITADELLDCYYALQDICRKKKYYIKEIEYLDKCIFLGTTYKDKITDKIKLSDRLRTCYIYRGRTSFHHFLLALEWDRRKEEKFYANRMNVLKPIVEDLQKLYDGVYDIYSLSMPPRTGKSTLGLLYMAWLGGMNPKESILAGGYATNLTDSFYQGVKDFIESDEYNYKEIFPDMKREYSSEKRTIDLGNNPRYKTMTFRSIDGTVTGATEAKGLLYLDDMCSGIEEAMNLMRLDKLYQKVTVDMWQRRVNNKRRGSKCPVLMIGTIWSVHDPLSRLRRLHKNNPKAKYVRLPALNERGESNFQYLNGVGFDTTYYLEMKYTSDPVSWECVYQQNPIEREGLLFPSDSLKFFFQLPNVVPDRILAVVDVAFGGEDYISMPICAIYGEDCYVYDVVFMNKADYKVTEPIVLGKILKYNIGEVEFEANNGGSFYARDVKRMLDAKGGSCNITSRPASGKNGKLARIIQYAPDIKNLYFLDATRYQVGGMYYQFMEQLTTFLQTGTSPHDDAPDSLAMLARKIKRGQQFGKLGVRDDLRGLL